MLAREALSTASVTVEHLPIGFGNENWRVEDGSGDAYILKVGPLTSAAKWASARTSFELATSIGVPIPRLVHFALRDDYIVRVYEWVDGQSPDVIADDPSAVAAFFSDLGAAVAALHSLTLDSFSSRLDDSAPAFEDWADYVGYRLHQIRGRCMRNDALDLPTLERACGVIVALAELVNDAAHPTLCHRDLHAANLLVDRGGSLLAVVDWDTAEAWDAAGEWFKLDWMLFPGFAGGEASFDAAYGAVHPDRPLWRERKRLVHLMETLNAIANARSEAWSAEFEARARSHLGSLLDQS
jgi:aminoglycoside phosphotransferase (APT) family kinase protein